MKNTMFLAIASVLLAAGCGSSSNTNVPPPVLPTTTDIATVGTISGFGSVIANGIEFNTDSATVTMDGLPGTLSDLRIGMVVSIRGTVNDATGVAAANIINFTDVAEGPITDLDTVNNTFVVLGRAVFFDEFTVFDDVTVDTLANGNVVQVSGYWRSQERIQATHIERKADAYNAGMLMEIEGEISGLNIGTQRFNIGTQACDYSVAMLDLGGADLIDGLYVEVSSTASMSNGDLILDRIQARDRDQDKDQMCDSDCDFDMDGYVTLFVSPTEFDVDGFPVTTTSTTVYVNGTVDTLAADVKVAVSGTIDATGVLIADKIVFRLPSLIEIQADVEAIDSNNAAITVLGMTVTTNESTLFRDSSTAGVREFGLDDLAIGDRVELRAYVDGTSIVATRLEREDADDTVTLKALVESVDRPSVTLLGITVSSNQDTVFQNTALEVIDADTFFSLVDVDSLVKTEGSYDGTSILADKLFLRECENNCL